MRRQTRFLLRTPSPAARSPPCSCARQTLPMNLELPQITHVFAPKYRAFCAITSGENAPGCQQPDSKPRSTELLVRLLLVRNRPARIRHVRGCPDCAARNACRRSGSDVARPQHHRRSLFGFDRHFSGDNDADVNRVGAMHSVLLPTLYRRLRATDAGTPRDPRDAAPARARRWCSPVSRRDPHTAGPREVAGRDVRIGRVMPATRAVPPPDVELREPGPRGEWFDLLYVRERRRSRRRLAHHDPPYFRNAGHALPDSARRAAARTCRAGSSSGERKQCSTVRSISSSSVTASTTPPHIGK